MAFNSNVGRVELKAGAGQTDFNFNFRIFSFTDIIVYHTPNGQAPNVSTDTLTIDVDYTVTINGESGGILSLNTGANLNDSITIQRSLPVNRLIDFQPRGDLTSENLNDDAEYQTYLVADQKAKEGVFLSVDPATQDFNTILPAPTPNSYIKFSEDGKSIIGDETIPQAVIDTAANAANAKVSEDNSKISEDNAKISEINAQASAASVDATTMSNRSSMVINTPSTLENLKLDSVTKIGQTEFLYTGTGVERTVDTTGIQLVNDNGDGVTLASDWADTTHALGVIVYDTSATGDSKPYECTVAITVATGISPRADVDATSANWKLADNQFGYRINFKNRTTIRDWRGCDSIRGLFKEIYTNTTATEFNQTQGLIGVSPFSVTIGTDVGYNTLNDNYLLEVEQTTRRTAGVLIFDIALGRDVVVNSVGLYDGTGVYNPAVHASLCEVDSAGNPVINHYNPVQGNGIRFRTGSGVAGTNAPSMGILTKLLDTKNLSSIASWLNYNFISGATKYLSLNVTQGEATSIIGWNNTEPTQDTFTYGTDISVNVVNNNYIDYYQGETPNTKIVNYQGTGAVGNDALNNIGMNCSVLGTKVTIKRLDAVGNWDKISNIRGGTQVVYADLSNAEAIDSDTKFTSTGLIIDITTGDENANGGSYLAIIKTPNYEQPISGKLIGFSNDIKAVLADGINANQAKKTLDVQTTALTTLDVGTGNANTRQHLFLKGDGSVFKQPYPLRKGLNNADADKWGVDVKDANGVVTGKTTARHGTYASDTGFVSASSQEANNLAWEALSHITSIGNGWLTLLGDTAGWWKNNLTKSRVIKGYEFSSPTVTSVIATNILSFPKTWTFEGSNDDTNWDIIENVTNYVPTGDGTVGVFEPTRDLSANTTSYKDYRINITANNGSTQYVGFGEIRLIFAIDDTPYLNITDNVIYTDVNDTVTDTFTELGTAVIDDTETVSHVFNAESNVTEFENLTVYGEAHLDGNTYLITPQNEEALPDLVAVNKKYLLDNPFGKNTPVEVIAEVFYDGIWSGTRWYYGDSSGNSGGVSGYYVEGVGIAIITGNVDIMHVQHVTGNPHGASTSIKSAPCRVRVIRQGGK